MSLSFAESVAFVWFLIDAITHLTIELGYLWLALTATGAWSTVYPPIASTDVCVCVCMRAYE